MCSVPNLATGGELLKNFDPEGYQWADGGGATLNNPNGAMQDAGDLEACFVLTGGEGVCAAYHAGDWQLGQTIHQQGGGAEKLIWPAYLISPLSEGQA